MRNTFLQELSHCKEVTLQRYRARDLIVRIKEPFARLLFPLI
jgi:hypothetical protein